MTALIVSTLGLTEVFSRLQASVIYPGIDTSASSIIDPISCYNYIDISILDPIAYGLVTESIIKVNIVLPSTVIVPSSNNVLI